MFSNIDIAKFYSNLDFPPWMFMNVMNKVDTEMKNSINRQILSGKLKTAPKKAYYTYLLIDIEKLKSEMEITNNKNLLPTAPTFKQFLIFKKCIFYVGKGLNNRKHQHLTKAKKLLCGILPLKSVELKVSKIAALWRQNKGVTLIQLECDATTYEAFTRENLIIKALNFNTLTNRIRGTCYGDVKTWTHLKQINFGNMLLYHLFQRFLSKSPNEIYASDVILKTVKAKRPTYCVSCKKQFKKLKKT